MTTRSKISTENSKNPSVKRRRSSENTSAFPTGTEGFAPSSAFGRALIKRVRNHDVRYDLLGQGSAILVACSGGPDSIALLHILLSLRKKLRIRLGIAHVNYRIRKEDSDKDELLVRTLCKKYDIPCSVFRPENSSGKNEEELRDIRYRFFERVREKERFDSIAIAHTEDDQAETVLIRLIRGTGPEGLAAMRPKNNRLIRPILDIPKRDILTFLHSENIPFREDATNRDTTILRNRIRHELIPLLEREYRPGIKKILSRTARLLEESMLLSSTDNHPLPTAEIGSGAIFSRTAFLRLPEAVRANELRHLYRVVSGTGKNPGKSFVLETEKLIGSTKGKVRIYRSGRLKIEARGDRVTMIRTLTGSKQ